MNYKITEVHISTIQPGDTIYHTDGLRTVNREHIKNDKFMGTSIFGDCYSLGRKKVKKVTFI